VHYWGFKTESPGQKIQARLFDNAQDLAKQQITVAVSFFNNGVQPPEAGKPQKQWQEYVATDEGEYETGDKFFHYFSTSMITCLTFE
jgi:hypothetical protein